MGLLVVLSCVSLWAGLALAEVGPFSRCQQYFYKGVEPEGFNTQRTAKICQRYNGTYHYATLYDRDHRIPRWSAYTLNETACEGQPQRRSRWFIEPQLFAADKGPDMTMEAGSGLTQDELRSSQAISEDYEDTSYDHGPLNPSSFHCDSSRTATFTLTNAAPMEPCFLRSRWHKLQHLFQAELAKSCLRLGGVTYLVTGTTPSGETIPREHEDREGDRVRPYHRVSVPSHVWTAACCDNRDTDRKFSLAFLAENREKSQLQILPIEQLHKVLLTMNATAQTVRIFTDDCNAQSQTAQEALSHIKVALSSIFRDLMSQPGEKNRQDEEAIQTTRSTTPAPTEGEQRSVGTVLEFPSLAAWHSQFTEEYHRGHLACVLSTGLEQASSTSSKLCILQKQKHLPGSDKTAMGWQCIKQVCGRHSGTYYRWCRAAGDSGKGYCCAERCVFNSVTRTYACARGDGEMTECSPQYSAVTLTGQQCRADFPCGLYGKKYFWCYTDYRDNWDYCCSPQHYCGHHGQEYIWCYVSDSGTKWKYCVP
ncbi:endonuclease domain-containing 1 protein-like [Alligator sinensis]|uniref:Endonuclease domain-containing 1 protein-like n=1 Tax=Alligator sinensis TaxID=38654 RepID=A0A3Q0FUP1_ALLSI|nr:endonuclease domain-containing 1 protein-like [Alligator sinensis]